MQEIYVSTALRKWIFSLFAKSYRLGPAAILMTIIFWPSHFLLGQYEYSTRAPQPTYRSSYAQATQSSQLPHASPLDQVKRMHQKLKDKLLGRRDNSNFAAGQSIFGSVENRNAGSYEQRGRSPNAKDAAADYRQIVDTGFDQNQNRLVNYEQAQYRSGQRDPQYGRAMMNEQGEPPPGDEGADDGYDYNPFPAQYPPPYPPQYPAQYPAPYQRLESIYGNPSPLRSQATYRQGIDRRDAVQFGVSQSPAVSPTYNAYQDPVPYQDPLTRTYEDFAVLDAPYRQDYLPQNTLRYPDRGGGYMQNGTVFRGSQLQPNEITATQRAIELQEELAELRLKLDALERDNQRLRQKIEEYNALHGKTSSKIQEATQQLAAATETNQQLKQRISQLESENEKIRLEAERLLGSIQRSLDDVLMRKLKESGRITQNPNER